MIGVILWSSPAKEKAVIWCEDHGSLAYLQGQENLAAPDDWPEAGDLVELEVEPMNDLRYARSVSLVSGNKRSELPTLLRGMGDTSEQAKRPFRVVTGTEKDVDERPLRVAAAG